MQGQLPHELVVRELPPSPAKHCYSYSPVSFQAKFLMRPVTVYITLGKSLYRSTLPIDGTDQPMVFLCSAEAAAEWVYKFADRADRLRILEFYQWLSNDNWFWYQKELKRQGIEYDHGTVYGEGLGRTGWKHSIIPKVDMREPSWEEVVGLLDDLEEDEDAKLMQELEEHGFAFESDRDSDVPESESDDHDRDIGGGERSRDQSAAE